MSSVFVLRLDITKTSNLLKFGENKISKAEDLDRSENRLQTLFAILKVKFGAIVPNLLPPGCV